MPLTLTKQQTKVETKVKGKDATATSTGAKNVLTEYVSLVDELAAIEQIITPEVQRALKRQERLKDELRAVADAQILATEKATFTGTKHNFTVTEKTEQRKIEDMNAARLTLGDKLFFACVKVNLSDIDKYLTDDQKSFISTSKTGPRKGTLVSK